MDFVFLVFQSYVLPPQFLIPPPLYFPTTLRQVEGKELKKYGSVAICLEDKWLQVLSPLNYANLLYNPITIF